MKPPPAASQRGRVSITIALSTLVIALTLALASSLVYFNYRSNRDAALLAARDMLAALAERVEERLRATIEPIVAIAELTPELAPLGTRAENVAPNIRRFLIRVVTSFSQVNSVYLGFEDGSMFRVASLLSFDRTQREVLEAPNTAVVVLFTLAAVDHRGPRETSEFLGADGTAVTTTRIRETTFDPRIRPWYVRALETDATTTTPPYRFSSSGKTGITAARRVPGVDGAVFGVDITLAELSSFLALQRPTPDASIYLFTPRGQVLAWAGSDRGDLSVDEAPDGIPSLTDFGDAFASMLHDQLLGNDELPDSLVQEGRSFITKRIDFTGPLGATNHLGFLVPTDHFTARITDLGRKSTIISVAFILATLPLIALASRVFSRPLHKLAAQADAIRRFELGGAVDVKSRVRELRALSTSMDRMKSGLRTFGVYVPRDLVRQMIAQSSPPQLGGERRDISILFSDVAGFTPIADRLEPEVVMQRMSTYFETATTAIRDNGGTIDKFMGDAVMAMWNALVDDPAHPHSACRGALAARDALAALSMRLAAAGLAPMPTRFGLHAGVAVVGNVGSSERMNFTALGASVNLAARLEPLNKVFGTEILVSEQLAARVRSGFHLRSVAVVKPKGVSQPLRIFELLVERGGGEAFDWVPLWETAFEAFAIGHLDEAQERLANLPSILHTDPVRTRLLDRINAARNARNRGHWDPVDTF